MDRAQSLVEIHRGAFVEGLHYGHAVICDGTGQEIKSWGAPETTVLPRSSVKMIQALPLILSGARDAFDLTQAQLALACASHQGAAIHTDAVRDWLQMLGLRDEDLRCGAQLPNDKTARLDLLKNDLSPCQYHNNCSGKHSGFLTLNKHLKAGAEYIESDHPVQKACLEMFEITTGATSPGFGIDGCSAPNYAAKLKDIGKAMAWFATAHERSDSASRAARQLVEAMSTYPELVAGKTRACTELMQAMGGDTVVKTGAEGVFIAIVPTKKLGIALKIVDGATRASECALATLLVDVGVLERSHPTAQKYLKRPITNWRCIETGYVTAVPTLTL